MVCTSCQINSQPSSGSPSAVETTAADPAKSAEQCDAYNDEQDGSE
jgi:hypothetical protein